MKKSDEKLEFKLSIDETARMFNTTKATLRYYDDIGLVDVERNRENNRREFNRLSIIQITDAMLLRQMNVPTKDMLKIINSSVEASLSELEDIHDRIELNIRRMAEASRELECSIKMRKKYLELKQNDFTIKAKPEFKYLTYWRLGGEKHLENFLSHPYTNPFAVVFFYEDSEILNEALLTNDDSPAEQIIFEFKEENRYMECLMKTKQAYPNLNDLDEIFEKIRKMGMEPGVAVARWLVTETSEEDGEKYDYYQALIEVKQL